MSGTVKLVVGTVFRSISDHVVGNRPTSITERSPTGAITSEGPPSVTVDLIAFGGTELVTELHRVGDRSTATRGNALDSAVEPPLKARQRCSTFTPTQHRFPEKARHPLSRTTFLTTLMVSCMMTLAGCQQQHLQTVGGQDERTAVSTFERSTKGNPSKDRSSATANADGSPIVFDPVEAGKNLPDPCLELPEDVLRDAGFLNNFERTPIGMDDELLGKGIICNLYLVDNYDGYRSSGIYSDNVTKEYIKERGLFIGDAVESIIPNSYYYAFSQKEDGACCIGASTQRGRIGLNISGKMDWPVDEACEEARFYFDRLYVVTDGFSWLKR